MLTGAEIESAARDLIAAETHRRQIGLLSLRHPGITLDETTRVRGVH